jgi:hypothetical protein
MKANVINVDLNQASYDMGYYQACKANRCHKALKYLDREVIMLPVRLIVSEKYEAGYRSGEKNSLNELSKNFNSF